MTTLQAAPPKATPAPTQEQKEEQLIKDLASPDADKVQNALGDLESMYDKKLDVTNSFPVIRSLLGDSREPVRRKAARISGIFHLQLTGAELKLVCAQLKASDWKEVQSGLKALRDLNVPSTVPDILPCLQHPVPGVVRDACRTLAVVANKDVIPSIQPLLNSPDNAVKKDAQDAIAKLQAK
jgi:HEAT repeat protein